MGSSIAFRLFVVLLRVRFGSDIGKNARLLYTPKSRVIESFDHPTFIARSGKLRESTHVLNTCLFEQTLLPRMMHQLSDDPDNASSAIQFYKRTNQVTQSPLTMPRG